MSTMDIYEQLKRDEGKRNLPYVDSVGKVTIGVGHNLTDKGLTDVQIDEILHDDVEEVLTNLETLPWFNSLDNIRQGVFINMAFNLGFQGLLAFQKTITFVEVGNYVAASEEMLDSKWAEQVGIGTPEQPGRALRLSQQLRTGQWV